MASKKIYENKWVFEGVEVEEPCLDMLGFVYKITNLTNDRFYIGRKNVISNVTKPPLKGDKKNRKISKESDWKFYWSSSDELKEDIKELGIENFRREILYWCKTPALITYLEQKTIFTTCALESNLSYNNWCDVKVRKSNIIGNL